MDVYITLEVPTADRIQYTNIDCKAQCDFKNHTYDTMSQSIAEEDSMFYEINRGL